MERNSLIPHPDGGNVYHLSRLDLIERKNHALPIPSRAGQKNKRRAARSIQIFCLRPLNAAMRGEGRRDGLSLPSLALRETDLWFGSLIAGLAYARTLPETAR